MAEIKKQDQEEELINESVGFGLATTKLTISSQYYEWGIGIAFAVGLALTILTSIFFTGVIDTKDHAFIQYLKLQQPFKYKDTSIITINLQIDKNNVNRFYKYNKDLKKSEDLITKSLEEGKEEFTVDLNIFKKIAEKELMISMSKTFLSVTTKIFMLFLFYAGSTALIFFVVFKKIIKKQNKNINKSKIIQGNQIITPEEYFEETVRLNKELIYFSPLFIEKEVEVNKLDCNTDWENNEEISRKQKEEDEKLEKDLDDLFESMDRVAEEENKKMKEV